MEKTTNKKPYTEILKKRGGWSNATGSMHLHSFAEFLDKKFEAPKKKTKKSK